MSFELTESVSMEEIDSVVYVNGDGCESVYSEHDRLRQ